MTDEKKPTARLEYPGGSAEFPIVPSVDGPNAIDIALLHKQTGLCGEGE